MQGLRLLIGASPDYMIPNHLRPDKKAQEFIVKAINFLGFEPFDKPSHRYTWEEFRQISEMYRTAKKEMSLLHRQCKRPKENRSSYYTLKGDQNAKH